MLDVTQSASSLKNLLNAAADRLAQSPSGAAESSRFSDALSSSMNAVDARNNATASSAAANAAASTGGASTVDRYKAAGTTTATTTTVPEKLAQDYRTYFDTVPAGTTMQAGGGTVTRNADGSATWVGGGKTYSYTRFTPLHEVAQNTGMGADWAAAYGFQVAAASSAGTTPESSGTDTAAKAPFATFDEFKSWEAGLGSDFADHYETPDYIHAMGLAAGGGDSEAFKRYVFFKNNPEYAVDFQRIHSGELSAYPTDGSTLIKSDLSGMDTSTATYFKQNLNTLRLAEGFNADPTLFKQRLDGTLKSTAGENMSEWLTQNRWTSSGVVANNNRTSYANADFIGLDGKGAGTYKLAKYDALTGNIVDLDGKQYNPTTGERMA